VRAAALLVAVLVVDQLTKKLVRDGMAIGDEDSIFPAVTLVHVKNRGVAFSAFSGQATVVIAIIGAAVLALLVYFATHADRRWAWVPTGLLAGGALGNILDRVRDGSVTDFIKLPAWPAFNIADVAITAGVLALLLVLEQGSGKEGDDDDAAERPA
jgi:signal peptidase II